MVRSKRSVYFVNIRDYFFYRDDASFSLVFDYPKSDQPEPMNDHTYPNCRTATIELPCAIAHMEIYIEQVRLAVDVEYKC